MVKLPGLGRQLPAYSKATAYIWKLIGKKKSFLKFMHKQEIDATKLEFVWNGFTYAVDLERVRKFGEKNEPILDYELNHSIPIMLGIEDKDLPSKDDSGVFNQLITNGVLKAILSAATRLQAITPTWIQILAGFGLGVVVTLIFEHLGLFGAVASGTGLGRA